MATAACSPSATDAKYFSMARLDRTRSTVPSNVPTSDFTRLTSVSAQLPVSWSLLSKNSLSPSDAENFRSSSFAISPDWADGHSLVEFVSRPSLSSRSTSPKRPRSAIKSWRLSFSSKSSRCVRIALTILLWLSSRYSISRSKFRDNIKAALPSSLSAFCRVRSRNSRIVQPLPTAIARTKSAPTPTIHWTGDRPHSQSAARMARFSLTVCTVPLNFKRSKEPRYPITL